MDKLVGKQFKYISLIAGPPKRKSASCTGIKALIGLFSSYEKTYSWQNRHECIGSRLRRDPATGALFRRC